MCKEISRFATTQNPIQSRRVDKCKIPGRSCLDSKCFRPLLIRPVGRVNDSSTCPKTATCFEPLVSLRSPKPYFTPASKQYVSKVLEVLQGFTRAACSTRSRHSFDSLFDDPHVVEEPSHDLWGKGLRGERYRLQRLKKCIYDSRTQTRRKVYHLQKTSKNDFQKVHNYYYYNPLISFVDLFGITLPAPCWKICQIQAESNSVPSTRMIGLQRCQLQNTCGVLGGLAVN